jgi:hypothetical protein
MRRQYLKCLAVKSDSWEVVTLLAGKITLGVVGLCLWFSLGWVLLLLGGWGRWETDGLAWITLHPSLEIVRGSGWGTWHQEVRSLMHISCSIMMRWCLSYLVWHS